jgi:hypothetical protein
MDSSYSPIEYFCSNNNDEKISKCILITDKSIYTEKNEVFFNQYLIFKLDLNNKIRLIIIGFIIISTKY